MSENAPDPAEVAVEIGACVKKLHKDIEELKSVLLLMKLKTAANAAGALEQLEQSLKQIAIYTDEKL